MLKVVLCYLLLVQHCPVFCEEKTKIPTPKTMPITEDVHPGVPQPYTEDDKKFIKKLHEEFPELPKDMFEIKETSFRRKMSPEEKKHREGIDKRKQELEKESLRQYTDRLVKMELEKQEEKLKRMSPEARDRLIEELNAELKNIDKKMAKKQEL